MCLGVLVALSTQLSLEFAMWHVTVSVSVEFSWCQSNFHGVRRIAVIYKTVFNEQSL